MLSAPLGGPKPETWTLPRPAMSACLRPAVATRAAMRAASPALAETLSFKADLTGASEVPAVTTPGTGAVTATYDIVTKRLA